MLEKCCVYRDIASRNCLKIKMRNVTYLNSPEVGGRVSQRSISIETFWFLVWPVLCSSPNLHGSILIFEQNLLHEK